MVLKPNADCNYKNVVDILDEMSINVIKRYAVVKISDVESKLIQITEASTPAK